MPFCNFLYSFIYRFTGAFVNALLLNQQLQTFTKCVLCDCIYLHVHLLQIQFCCWKAS
jgi:hypothetical protein